MCTIDENGQKMRMEASHLLNFTRPTRSIDAGASIASIFLVVTALLANPAQAGMPEATSALRSGNVAEAATQFHALAEAGQPEAQFELAKILADAIGAPKDLPQSEQWMRRAAEQGYRPAQAALGQMYAGAYGMTPNPKLSYVWLSLVAANGDAAARNGRDQAIRRLSRDDVRAAQDQAVGLIKLPILDRDHTNADADD